MTLRLLHTPQETVPSTSEVGRVFTSSFRTALLLAQVFPWTCRCFSSSHDCQWFTLGCESPRRFRYLVECSWPVYWEQSCGIVVRLINRFLSLCDLPSWPFIEGGFCLGVAAGFAVCFLACAALGCASCWTSHYVAPSEKAEIAWSFTLPTGVWPLRLIECQIHGVRQYRKISWLEVFIAGRTVVRSYRCSRVGSHRKFELCWCTVTTNCRRWNVRLSRLTFLMEARLPEAEIDGEDVTQVCILELPCEPFENS